MALNFVALNTEHEKIFEAAIAGIQRVAELIATIPPEQRVRALNAAEQSYQKTARDLGYEDAAAQRWASAIISRLWVFQLPMEEEIGARNWPANGNPEIGHRPE
jgi:hypothetical protein